MHLPSIYLSIVMCEAPGFKRSSVEVGTIVQHQTQRKATSRHIIVPCHTDVIVRCILVHYDRRISVSTPAQITEWQMEGRKGGFSVCVMCMKNVIIQCQVGSILMTEIELGGFSAKEMGETSLPWQIIRRKCDGRQVFQQRKRNRREVFRVCSGFRAVSRWLVSK